ncbi:MAG: argininosuccinate synthase [bacterium]
MKKKVVLAYSGGLDTTVIIPWLKENYDYDVIAVCVDLGQGTETEGLEEKAISTGASKFFLVDVKDEFVTDYIFPTLKAGAIYENRYLLGTSMARPLIAKVLAKIAIEEGAEAICHGATGKGNDQVRFELGIKAFAPNMKIIAPWRMWDLKSREDLINYLQKKGINLPFRVTESYSRDKNLWHLSHEGLELEDPSVEPDYEKILQIAVPLEKASDTPEYVELEFIKGIPVKLNGEEVSPVELIKQLNIIGGRHSVGLTDLVENRVVGIKARGVYENPAGAVLFFAHEQLEHICLDRQTYSFKQNVANRFAELTYAGEWFTLLRESLSAFIDYTQLTVTGTVKLKLFKGNIIPAGTTSPYSLYDESLASFTTGDLYSHKDAEGFINLYGLPIKVRALMSEAKGLLI